jgi:hypothetical protein
VSILQPRDTGINLVIRTSRAFHLIGSGIFFISISHVGYDSKTESCNLQWGWFSLKINRAWGISSSHYCNVSTSLQWPQSPMLAGFLPDLLCNLLGQTVISLGIWKSPFMVCVPVSIVRAFSGNRYLLSLLTAEWSCHLLTLQRRQAKGCSEGEHNGQLLFGEGLTPCPSAPASGGVSASLGTSVVENPQHQISTMLLICVCQPFVDDVILLGYKQGKGAFLESLYSGILSSTCWIMPALLKNLIVVLRL